MSDAYRNELDAALARVASLETENARLRQEAASAGRPRDRLPAQAKEIALRFEHMKVIDDKVTLETIPPGGSAVIQVAPVALFKGLRAEPVKGIDYAAFRVVYVAVGAASAWKFHSFGGDPWPASDLLKRWDQPMIPAAYPTPIGLHVRNVSDVFQLFAVDIVGLMLIDRPAGTRP